MATASLPPWIPPPEPSAQVRDRLPRLNIYNTLTRTKVPFVPLDPEGKTVTWYACGPTVYDDAHFGHARNYVSTDIIRRILTQHFGFQVKFVMNITDVDDKIIIAARRQHFLEQYMQSHPEADEHVTKTVLAAYQKYIADQLALLQSTDPADHDKETKDRYGHVLQGHALANDGSKAGDKEAKIKMHLKTIASAAMAMAHPKGQTVPQFYQRVSGVLSPYLDSLHKQEVDPHNHTMFKQLAKRYEDRFFEDMRSLNVRVPDNVTRVTEYGPQIVDFVKQIQKNGFAYEMEGSVYYNSRAWEAAGGVYARLEPWNKNDTELQADGEGSLSKPSGTFEKPASDFALWKASKAGEPGWQSPWGLGRPGWHIECSCMASDILGSQFDIHSGGVDLAFPHHDNELVQSEAYWKDPEHDSKQWVNYFIHMGHLSIQGAKMSKSLKNFTTIRESLARGEWTARSLRIAFLLGAWRDGFEITDDVTTAGRSWEERLDNIFLKALDVSRTAKSHSGDDTAENADQALNASLSKAQANFDKAMCDSFNTPDAMRTISDLITAYNSSTSVSDHMTIEIATWLAKVVDIFGLDATPVPSHIGWSGIDIPEAAKQYVYPMAALRDEIRSQAKSGEIANAKSNAKVDIDSMSQVPSEEQAKPYQATWTQFYSELKGLRDSSSSPKQYLELCDRLRDDILWKLGIYLEDRTHADGTARPAMVRPLNATLREERNKRDEFAAAKQQKALELRLKTEKDDAAKKEKARQSHLEMFRTAEFTAWDDEGMPTKDAEGAEVAKSRTKKLRKEWERQKKLHEAYLAEQKSL